MEKTPEIDKAYVSPIDKFLHIFDKTHAPTASQKREKVKHEKLFKKRDAK